MVARCCSGTITRKCCDSGALTPSPGSPGWIEELNGQNYPPMVQLRSHQRLGLWLDVAGGVVALGRESGSPTAKAEGLV